MYLKLYTAVSFSHRLSYLRGILEEGKGFSQITPFDHAQNVGVHELLDQEGKEQDEEAYGQYVVQERSHADTQEHREGKAMGSATESGNVALASTLEAEPAQSTDTFDVDGQAQREATVGTTEGEGQTNVAVDHETFRLVDQQASIGDVDAEAVRVSEQGNAQCQEGQEPALTHDKEDVIDYEDDEELAPKSSAGSSTLQGDVVEAAADDILPSSDQTATLKNNGLPGTERSSHTLEGSLTNDPASHLPQMIREEEKSYGGEDALGDDGNRETEYGSYNDIDNEAEEIKEIEHGDGDQLQDELEGLGDTGGTAGNGDEVYAKFANNDEHGSFEKYLATAYEPDEVQISEPKADDEGGYAEALADTEENSSYDQNDLFEDPLEGNEPSQENSGTAQGDGDYDQGPNFFAEDPATTPIDDSKYYENEGIADAAADATTQPPRQGVDQAEDNDEITYEDEEGVEQDPPSPGSLKRPRSQPDVDDAAADDLQGK